MAAWERVWIDAEAYSQDPHSIINCTECHGGQAVDDMTLAHIGLVERPARNPETCGDCHRDIIESSLNSLHSTLAGYDTALHARSTPENHPVLEEMQANHCNDCHTTCADCHITQPFAVGGGLLRGHTYVRTPPMTQTCTACHGTRVKNEYFGLNEGYPSDVHFRARMSCTDCHTADQIHGVGITAQHRHEGPQQPSCVDCHQEQVGVGSGIEEHEIHGTEMLSCQSCHSVSYTNCASCHVAMTDGGVPFYTVGDYGIGFYLGRNALQSAYRPYRYVPLRQVPIDPEAFSFYGDNLMPNFDDRPTWMYATPHNIQRNTPQTESCASCHGNDDIFLTADKLPDWEINANRTVLVEGAPPLPDGYQPQMPVETDTAPTAPDAPADFWGGADATPTPVPPADFWGGADATPTPVPPADFWGGADTTPTPVPPADFWGG